MTTVVSIAGVVGTRPATTYSTGMPAIGICGSYGGLNVGDEAILTVMIDQLRQAIPGVELTVFTRNVEHTAANHRVEHAMDARESLRDELVRAVERLDLVLLGGGGILYDDEAELYLHLPRIAQQLGVRTATYAIGAGPLQSRAGRRAVASVLAGAAAITVRDARSRRLLEELGVERQITVTADPALLLEDGVVPSGVLEREGIDGERRLVGLSVREPGAAAAGLEPPLYHRLLAHAADFVADRFDADLLFVAMERQDVRHAHRVIAEMGLPDRARVLTGCYRPRELLGIVGRLDMAIGMRLHFLIFAALSGVPILGLPYASKVSSFLQQLGLTAPQQIQPEHAGTLLAAIDRTWDLREDASRLIRGRLPALQLEARRSAAIVAELVTPNLIHAPARSA
jgi:polysaccharide pyruvyl transferase CsaB